MSVLAFILSNSVCASINPSLLTGFQVHLIQRKNLQIAYSAFSTAGFQLRSVK